MLNDLLSLESKSFFVRGVAAKTFFIKKKREQFLNRFFDSKVANLIFFLILVSSLDESDDRRAPLVVAPRNDDPRLGRQEVVVDVGVVVEPANGRRYKTFFSSSK
jgi:hypothetical protein